MASGSELAGKVALVTGGGRGIGRGVALELPVREPGWPSRRGRAEQVEQTAAEIGGIAIEADVSKRADVERMVATAEAELGPLDLLVNNAGIALWEEAAWDVEPEEWWHVLEVNLLGVYLCCRTVIPGMIARGSGRIVNVASGAAYLPGSTSTAYSASKAGVHRFSETLANQLEPHGIPVFSISPGLVRTDLIGDNFGDDAPWTPPELAPRLVRALASGRLDALSGHYLHAEHDDIDDVEQRAAEIVEADLNSIRLRR